MARLVAIDGPPGVGKTTRILERAAAGELEAVVTFGNAAADVVTSRAPEVRAGTIFSLAWQAGAGLTTRRGYSNHKTSAPHLDRALWGSGDSAADRYAAEAPSRKQLPQRLQVKLDALQAWDGSGEPPVDLDDKECVGHPKMKYEWGLGRWHRAGCPWKDSFEGFGSIALDEAQDFSALQLSSALALLRPGGVAWAYGDPGQAIGVALEPGQLPAVWERADEKQLLSGGHRVGFPAAGLAAAALDPYWSRPAETFAAPHETVVLPWDTLHRPERGLVMGYARTRVIKAFREWGLRETWVVPNRADPQSELILSTIHAAKGAQADDVYVLPNKSLCDRLLRRDPGALRVIYVAMTRAKRRLFLPTSIRALLPK